jgi:hypothetical protein
MSTRGTETSKELMKCSVSEPLPSNAYALPKDHKSGPLKGRPIISTCASVVRPLSQLIAKVLNPLIPKFVNAHIKSTSHFLDSLRECTLDSHSEFGSLDVTNLYGNIPLEDDTSTNTLGLISVATEFFATHRTESSMPVMDPQDFKALLRLCLYEDEYLFNGQHKRQTQGIAMGNCCAPPLAIIYMDMVEKQILLTCPYITTWIRYIDDIFFIISDTSDKLLEEANTVNPFIKFTLEKAVNGSLPFLDSLVHLNGDKFAFELYTKPTHSGTCLTYDSHVPMQRKTCLIISENIRANRIGSTEYKYSSVNKVNERLSNNGYPKSLIQKTCKLIKTDPREKKEYANFICVPFISQSQRNQIIKTAHRTGMHEKIRIIFKTERSLAWQFRAKPEQPKCPTNCLSCSTAAKPNCCFTKCAIYKITCCICNLVYIGQTGRTMRSRIHEHIKSDKSHVFLHMRGHATGDITQFQWRVITTHPYETTRLAIEAQHINKNQHLLINGCDGAPLLPSLY